jgi:crotonobetainyl-CoA:carnitine CoA-transferase CaiB-like acyl-CoA transferase
VAVAVATDEQWASLRRALDDPPWAQDPALDGVAGRRRAHDQVDAELAAWCRARPAEEIVERLWGAGVPVAVVTQPHHQPDLPPLQSRGFFEDVDHPVSGTSRHSTLPMRFSRGPKRFHERHAPLLGEHTRELLAELGLGQAELDALDAAGVIGNAMRVTA